MLSDDQTRHQSCGIAPPEYRLPPDTHVGLVRLQVSDLQRSIEYYQQVLGLSLYTATGDTAMMGAQGGGRPLLSLHTGTGVTPARRGALGLFHFAVLLPDRAALGRFASHLSDLGAPVGMADHLVSEALYLQDPDGLGIEVYADRPRSTWQRRDRELIMTTEPLDLGSVIRAAEGRAWEGAPAGTTIGHVHLHVGGLDEAEAFYHAGLGLDKMVWSYPGALFLAAGGYHHHLGTNIWSTGPRANDDEARLLDWQLVVSARDAAAAAGESLRNAGYKADWTGDGLTAVDPWGTGLRIAAAAPAPPSGVTPSGVRS